jgi:MFS family permease
VRYTSAAAAVLNRRPLAGRYPAAAAIALLALSPFLVLTTAISLMEPQLIRDLDATPYELQLANGLATAGYAFGAVAAVDLSQRLPSRRVYLLAEVGFAVSSVLALSSTKVELFATAIVLRGLFTGILLVAAIPPLVVGHGAGSLPITGALVSFGLFGIATIGPLIGGTVGSLGGWRALYAAITVLAVIGLSIGIMTFDPIPPTRPGARFDWYAIPLAFGVTALPFFGVSGLTRGSFSDAEFIAPVVVGLVAGAILLVSQYKKADPLVPVRPISNTLPVTGTATAMLAGAAFTTLLELTEVYLLRVSQYSPVRTGALLAPQIVGVAVAALVLRRVLPTRWTPYLALSGLLGIAVGGAILLALNASNAAVVVPIASVFFGYGAGAGVVPGLFLAGLAVRAVQVGATFAMVELLRSEAAFLVGPALLHLGLTRSDFRHGFDVAVLVVLGLIVAGGLFLIGLWRLGGVHSEAPDLEAWVNRTSTGYHSPPVAATIRKACRLD